MESLAQIVKLLSNNRLRKSHLLNYKKMTKIDLQPIK
jgi:hypothetical protein